MSRRAKVTFDYKATENDELDLVVGQIIEGIVEEDVGWCKGFLEGKTGLFPSNFVEFISDPEMPAPADLKPPKDSLAGRKAKVTFDYDASNEDELSLKVGDIVEVICEAEDGWWEGKLHGNSGVFPSNFVALVEEDKAPVVLQPQEEVRDAEPDEAPEEDGNKRSSIFGQTKMMGGGMGFGNIINAGILSGTKLKRVDTKPKKDPEPEAKPQPEISNSMGSPLKKITGSSLKRKAPSVPPPVAPASSTPPAPPVKKVEKAKVLFDYEKQNDDELNLFVGDIVTVLNKDVYETEGWWEGELNGKTGLFPDNFVELLPEEEEPVKEQRVKHQKTVPAPPLPGQEKRAPPPLPKEETRITSEPIEKDMKKASDHDAPKLPAAKHNTKPSIDFVKPNLPPKKPVPPKPSTKPLITKKPVPKAPTDHKKDVILKTNTKDRINEDKSRLTSEECNLDVVAPHELLKQLTANRAKQQSKRPPSTTRQSEGSLIDTSMELDEEETKMPIEIKPKEPAWKREAREAREAKEANEKSPAVKEKKIPPPVLEKPDEIVEKRKSWLRDDIPVKKADIPPKKLEGASSDEVRSLRQEVTDLRSLLSKMEKMMSAMEQKHEERMRSMERRLEKEIEQLTSDFDEERTNHARLKIEVDRLKKKMRRDSSSFDGEDASHA